MPLQKLSSLPHMEGSKLENLLNTILNTIADGIVIFDRSGAIHHYDRNCERLFGFALPEIKGRNIRQLIPSYFIGDPPYDPVRTVFVDRKEGSKFPIELTIGKTGDGQELLYVAVIKDVTEKVEAEKAKEQLRHIQKMESLGQLTGGIAHDFNNLLAVILGNLDFLSEKINDNSLYEDFIQPSMEAAEHGAELTQQLLAFGRKQTLQPRTIILSDLLSDFQRLVRRTLSEKIAVFVVIEPDSWNVKVDPGQLQNALLNLAVNARDAMPVGGKLVIETRNVILDDEYVQDNTDVAAGEYVMIAVSDTGVGMSTETAEKAFEPFFTTKDVGKGSGLGLSMVYGFVKQSAGHVKLYSEQGYGTSVKIYLPRAKDAEAMQSKKTYDGNLNASQNMKIVLIVEDNKNVLKLTSAMVESLGYNVLRAESGEAALKILSLRSDILLLLTDIMLPGVLNGPALARRAVTLHPDLKVLYNSGYAEHAILQRGLLEDGMVLLSKPFRKQDLAEKINMVLGL